MEPEQLRRKLSPITTLVLLLFMGVGIMNIRVSAEFPCSRQCSMFENEVVVAREMMGSVAGHDK